MKKLKIKRHVIALLASMHFFGNPSAKLKIIGVTGTNGKTTIVTLLYNLFTKLGYKVGIVSTVNVLIAGKEFKIERKNPTTPDVLTLNKILNKMVEEKCEYVFMEVTSHAMDQGRVAGIKFKGGIFTNLTHDHLDYHKNIENYFKAKKKFFKKLPKNAFALSNIDDPHGPQMLEGIRAQKYTYGFKNSPLTGSTSSLQASSGQFSHFNEKIETKLLGDFNAYNILASYAMAILLGKDKVKVKAILKNVDSAEGRFECVKSATGIIGIVDYSHSADALENVLKTIQAMKNEGQRIISVFGCGGGLMKDHSKRPTMTQIVYVLSDIVIPTADNPREEDIEDIFEDMKKGLPKEITKEVYFIADRGEAIKKACELARTGDYILLAGKGHEKYQEIKGVKYPFNDMEELKKNLTF